MPTRYLLIASLLLVVTPTDARAAEVPDTHDPATLLSFYAEQLDELLPGIGAAEVADRAEPRAAFRQLWIEAGAPGHEARRAAVSLAMAERLTPDVATPARMWLLRQLEDIGGAEAVSHIAKLLDADDPHLREAARQVLCYNRSAEAGVVLQLALDSATDPAWRVALLQALADRCDDGVVATVMPLLESEVAAVRSATAALVGRCGDAAAVDPLLAALEQGDANAVPALLSLAERLVKAGETAPAVRIYQTLSKRQDDRRTARAALVGLAQADFESAWPAMRALILLPASTPHPLQIDAVRIAAAQPDPNVAQLLAVIIPLAKPPVQVALLDALGRRGDVFAVGAARAAAQADDPAVVAAACTAVGRLGDADDVALLGQLAGEARHSAVRTAAAEALARLTPVDEVNAQLIAAVADKSSARVRGVLIDALAARRAHGAIPVLLQLTEDDDAPVRQATYRALGTLADAAAREQLLARLLAEPDDDAADAAADAFVRLSQALDDPEQRAAPVLEAWAQNPDAHVALLRVLGRLQGDAALQRIRTSLDAADAEVVEAAVRALAGWDDGDVYDDLIHVAQTTDRTKLRILALRGVLEIVRQENASHNARKLKALAAAEPLIEQDPQRRMLLAALATVRHPDAFRMAAAQINAPGVKQEAIATLVRLAPAVAIFDRELVGQTLSTLSDADVPVGIRRELRDARRQLEELDKHLTAWVYCGPFTILGKSGSDLLAAPLPPEQDDPNVNWQLLPATNPNQPWHFDLTKLDDGGDQCLVVRTTLHVPAAQPAKLWLGSDDGVRAILNGEMVHHNPAARGLTPREDEVDVNLKAGANTLLLKISQLGGGWGFTADLTTPAGEPIEGLRTTAE